MGFEGVRLGCNNANTGGKEVLAGTVIPLLYHLLLDFYATTPLHYYTTAQPYCDTTPLHYTIIVLLLLPGLVSLPIPMGRVWYGRVGYGTV